MTEAQTAALEAARTLWGKAWKDKLLTAWMRNCFPSALAEHVGELKRLRDTRGAYWLLEY